MHTNLVYVYTETPLNNKTKYTCTAEIKIKQQASNPANTQAGGLMSLQQFQSQTDVISEFKFSGEGMSKKEAKKNCSHIALMGLYPDSYLAPAEAYTCSFFDAQLVLNAKNTKSSTQQPSTQPLPQSATTVAANDLTKRIDKLFKNAEKTTNKSPAQLLHELSVKIAETGKCIYENGTTPETKFCFQFKNIKDESCVPSDFTLDDIYADVMNVDTNDLTKFAHGFGKFSTKNFFKLKIKN